MVEKEEESRTTRFGITKTWFIRWVIASSVTILVCYAVRPFVSYEDEFSVLVNAMNVISYSLGIGLPVFLASSIAFGTSNARRHILALLKFDKKPVEVFLRCLVEVYALVSLFSVSITIALFLEPQIMGVWFRAPAGTGFLIYLLPVLVATLIVSLLLATIGVFLVIVTDDIIISTSMGCALTIGLATAIGWNPRALWDSLTHGIAMLSPHNLARILAGFLSSYDPPHDTTIAGYFGFDATAVSILGSLVAFAFLAFICIIVSIKILRHNTSYWPVLQEASSEIWVSESERRGDHAKIKKKLKARRLVLVGLVIFLLTSMAFGTASYKITVRDETTIHFHQSPEVGEPVELGEWYVFSCNVQPPRFNQFNILHYECLLVDWGTAPDDITYYRSMLNSSSAEFTALNETSRRSLCSSRNRTRGEWGGTGGSWNIGYDYGTYIYVLKFIATENATLSGVIHLSIDLYQSAQ